MASVVRTSMTRFDLPKLIDAMGIKTGVEVGTHCGWFSYYLLKHSAMNRLWSVDAWGPRMEGAKEHAHELLEQFGSRSEIVSMPSVSAAKHLSDLGIRLGFVYIDANHRAKCVRQDIEAWLPLADEVCIFGGHDYVDVPGCSVIPAVNVLMEREDATIYLTKERWASWFVLWSGYGSNAVDAKRSAGPLSGAWLSARGRSRRVVRRLLRGNAE